ncbi:MAG: class I SAM-dependent methyltransferase, partial [Pyrinomonadaceae bacterium]
EKIVDFGSVALAGAFIKPAGFQAEQRFPLRVHYCTDCFALQVIDIVDPSILFANYFYFSSAIQSLRDHFVDYANEVVPRFLDPLQATAVEIGCNDGILLKPLANHGIRTVIGVDPATNIVNTINDPRITLINTFFSSSVAREIREAHGPAQLVVANNVYAHIPDINDVTKGVAELLDTDGVFVFEAHYLGSVINGLQYDMIYHEHLYYYSLIALENHLLRHGLIVFDLKAIAIHGGSMRFYICKKTSRRALAITEHVTRLRKEELERGYDRLESFQRFADEIDLRRRQLMSVLENARDKGLRVAGYGASGRANTIIQYCGITNDHVEFMIDDASAKWGYFTPGSHIEIWSRDSLSKEKPDYLLVFAWGYLNEIARHCKDYLDHGGKLLTPLPEVRLVSHPQSG